MTLSFWARLNIDAWKQLQTLAGSPVAAALADSATEKAIIRRERRREKRYEEDGKDFSPEPNFLEKSFSPLQEKGKN